MAFGRCEISLSLILKEMLMLTGAKHGRAIMALDVVSNEMLVRFWADGQDVCFARFGREDLSLSLNDFSMRHCQMPAIYWLRKLGNVSEREFKEAPGLMYAEETLL